MLSSHLVKLIECILNNSLSVFLIIKLYTFTIYAACTDASLEMDTATGACVCALNYYENTAGDANTAPVCTKCPPGSTTTSINSKAIGDCGKNARIISPID